MLIGASSACGHGSRSEPSTAPPYAGYALSPADLAQLRDRTVREAGPLPAAILTPALADANEEQRALLADGKLTLSEYQRAYLAWVACMNDAGVPTVAKTTLDGMGEFDTSFTAARREAFERAYAATGTCGTAHMRVVARVWSELMAPVRAALMPATRTWMAKCVTDAGYTAADRPWRTEVEAAAVA
jgi:hypothetical protein